MINFKAPISIQHSRLNWSTGRTYNHRLVLFYCESYLVNDRCLRIKSSESSWRCATATHPARRRLAFISAGVAGARISKLRCKKKLICHLLFFDLWRKIPDLHIKQFKFCNYLLFFNILPCNMRKIGVILIRLPLSEAEIFFEPKYQPAPPTDT